MSNKETWVKVFIPRGYANEERNFFVGINGKNYLLPRGKESLVPPEVAYEVKRVMQLQSRAEATKDKLSQG